MFTHIFVTRLKCLIRSKELVFWSLVFPIVLVTLFKIAFANILSSETFKPIDIAVVSSGAYDSNIYFKSAVEAVSKDGTTPLSKKLFNVTYTDEKNAEALLKENKIKGYIYQNPEINLAVKSSGLEETVLKTFLDNYKQWESTIAETLKTNPKADIAALMKDAASSRDYTKEVSPSRGTPNTAVNYFYSVIALACMYGGFLGLKEVTDIQGDLSKRAARINMAPVHKLKVFIYGLSAGLLIQYVQSLVILSYLYFVLRVDFGNQLPYILLLCLVGSAAGVSFGTMISALINKGEGLKIAVLIGVSSLGSFLAGMYYANMKYIIQSKAPLLHYINPVALITDGFYALYYYNTHSRYLIDIAVLSGLSVVFCYITYMIIRRQKYASI